MPQSISSNYSTEVSLPSFGKITKEFNSVFQHRVRVETRNKGAIPEISSHFVHEGKGSAITRRNEPTEDVKMHSASAEINLPTKEIEKFGVMQALEAIEKMAEQFAKQQSEMLFATIDEATKKTGNVVEGKGEPISHELLLKALDTVQHEFENGIGSSKLTLVISPQMEERVRKLQMEFKASEELQEAHRKLMTKKYEEFRNREMDRTLVG